MQSGVQRDSVSIESCDLNLKSLKDLACNFVDRKFPDHGLTRLPERLLLFRHDYSAEALLVPINSVSEISEGTLVEVVVSQKDPSDDIDIRPHCLAVHSYKSPTFCDFCGEMLFGLMRQGLKCDGCGQNFHKRCAYKIPNNCTHTRRRRSSSYLPVTPPTPTSHKLSSPNCEFKEGPGGAGKPLGAPAEVTRAASSIPAFIDDHSALLATPPCREKRSPSLNMGRPAWVERELAGRIRIPHSFLVDYSDTSADTAADGHPDNDVDSDNDDHEGNNNLHNDNNNSNSHNLNHHNNIMNSSTIGGISSSAVSTAVGRHNAIRPTNRASQMSGSVSGNVIVTGRRDQSESNQDGDNKQTLNETSSNNIPLMRIVQSVKHTKKRGQGAVVKEGWLVHYTSKDALKKKHFWRLDTKAVTMFQNESSSNYYKEIPLSDIMAIELRKECSPQQFCFELKTATGTYFVGEERDKSWETAIRQALLPVSATSATPPVVPTVTRFGKGGAGTTAEEHGQPGAAGTTGSGANSANMGISLRYQIFPDEVLGSGQFGIVYGGVHRTTQQPVAIKVIDKLRFPTKQEAQLKNEVSILENIHHPGVVTLERTYETHERIFVVMEKLKGDMLEMILQSPKGRLSERTTRFLIYQILIALKFLHSQNIVHCDLKPENVLLSSDSEFPQVKLCDFGFARIIGEKSFRRSVVGTPAYLAPEDEDINDQIQNADFMYPPQPWREISPEAVDLITNLLQVKTRKRLTVDKSLVHVWLQDFDTWLDLLQLEAHVGQRYLTHESDDARWESYARQKKLPLPPRAPCHEAGSQSEGGHDGEVASGTSMGETSGAFGGSHTPVRHKLSVQPEVSEPTTPTSEQQFNRIKL
ncbi:Serine/threonine-protein kinase D3-like [Tropilaelaps mercedesae]|uniref:protein kinase C n=1 Tax=Tropilaelaps mercedesae TaxID=418985 RepID=A0A1V9XSL5_9ACAR|nr:Serine/threonine-protein kinase D3-like [Tropilaelaps mercedesae]